MILSVFCGPFWKRKAGANPAASVPAPAIFTKSLRETPRMFLFAMTALLLRIKPGCDSEFGGSRNAARHYRFSAAKVRLSRFNARYSIPARPLPQILECDV